MMRSSNSILYAKIYSVAVFPKVVEMMESTVAVGSSEDVVAVLDVVAFLNELE